ncbi:hypothetical protein JL39_28955 [Rhizobium sp. YS-1r]|nr:hypothetical protein JL39_28955 [Rhizobium sp. YS-1r]
MPLSPLCLSAVGNSSVLISRRFDMAGPNAVERHIRGVPPGRHQDAAGMVAKHYGDAIIFKP